ncbi:hypothetical protein P153DRAFT_420391 [Dothidotthia symphoricarpi CBS 119687]|uniref:Phytase-like domain-containing protein n=1 Tax=Dothidotthia symphoricarpi CBS 119687 TaxID=1392245 RepID=A0A6A6ARG8_9PLEO|nr:uncharacterized protein P153DRAFT_420391 [Dothidotthia symphoricarpi CBS 119687]KAF2133544.1 hypothetical protein P153DRAFT_420391 [Dothidotthia symphoricarpi CBS 119687]
MLFIAYLNFLALALPSRQVVASPVASNASTPVNVTTCNGQTYMYEELAGYGKLASDARDKFGDTIGGIGSAIAVDKTTWKKVGTKAYQGIVYGLPDRGWNTQGTQNTQSRIHKFSFNFTIVDNATVANPAAPNFKLTYLDTLLLTGPDGTPLTGLDPTGNVSYPGFPSLPLATYTGNGFGQNGTGGSRIALDTEGLVLGAGGTYWISDEYAPYIYQFSPTGQMLQAIRTPPALIPLRNNTQSFSAASPPIYDPTLTISPEDPDSGRANNQGLEALTASPNGTFLYTMLQSATIQDGGSKSSTRRYTRLLQYRIDGPSPVYEAEYVVPLPLLSTGKVAGQSDMHYISPTQFLVLARDSNAGHGAASSMSMYRNADIIDISAATNVKGAAADAATGQIASRKGVLNSGIVPATYCPWLDYNVNAQLNRFGVHNGGAQDAALLNEKWESFALLPIEGDEYYLLSFSDNDFITQNGYINFGAFQYKDASGYDLDSQVLKSLSQGLPNQ